MSYQTTQLIARRGYSDLGDASSCGTGQEWDANCTYNGIKGQCVPAGTVGKATGCSYPSSGGVTGFLGSLFSGVVNLYGQTKYNQGQSAAYGSMQQPAASGTPSWVVPVAIGAVGLGAIMLLKSKRKNPARRRRHRR